MSACPACRTALLLLVLLTTAPPVWSQEPVFLRGHRVTPEHIVFGMVEGVKGGSAILNLGSAHGMRAGLPLLVVRTVHNDVMPVGALFVTDVEEDHSRARVEGPFNVQKDDFVLIHASRLNLWGGTLRMERLLRQRLGVRQFATRYSTLNSSPELIDEVARDDEFQARQYIDFDQQAFTAEATRKIGTLNSRLGAVSPLPQLNPVEEEGLKRPAPEEVDVTLDGLSRFAEIARTPEALRARMTLERLQALRPLDPRTEVGEDNATLLRETLLVCVSRALSRAK